jgi:hypothetical protein
MAKILSFRLNLASSVHCKGTLVGSILQCLLSVESGVGGFFGCGPLVGSYLSAYKCFVQGVHVIAVCHIEVQVVSVEARQQTFLYSCGDVVVAQVECVAASSIQRPYCHTTCA